MFSTVCRLVSYIIFSESAHNTMSPIDGPIDAHASQLTATLFTWAKLYGFSMWFGIPKCSPTPMLGFKDSYSECMQFLVKIIVPFYYMKTFSCTGLSQRTRQVQIKGTLSEKKQLTTGVPQGSCLGPVLFTIYVADLFQIIDKHLPEAQGYADDHQVYLSFRPIPSTNQTASVNAIENCVAELRSWMISNMLMVNDSKTEFLIVGSKQQLERVNIPFIHVGEDQITPVTSVRNLGVIFDSNLKMDMHITKACQNAYYHLHNIRRIRKFLSQEATCTIIHAFITSQIDYCNSLMNGLPDNLIKKLQRLQNTAARLVFNLRKYDRITPALVTLHWLPVQYRIEFKTLLIVFKGLRDKAPTYIQETVAPSKSKRYSIRSNEERVLKVPKFKHDTFGKRAFAVYGPLAWNCLPK